ncbi:MAG TPA: NAD(P)-dependent alcohol dehydrogenase [Pantanalinema sp.]
MKAAVYRQYGSPEVVRIEEVAKPEPKDDEVLIRVKASTVSSGDWRARSLKMPAGFGLFARPVFGIFGPRQPILGTELAGEIEAVGKAVTKFKVGDAVFASSGFGMGCHAEYRTMPEDGPLVPIPAGASFEEAAAISFGGNTALYYLRDLGTIAAGDEVLIIGASGAVGSASVQLAKHFGARVTAVTSTPNVERVKTLGADRVIDYTTTSFLDDGKQYDLVFDTVGSIEYASCRAALKEEGRLLLCGASLPQMLKSMWDAKSSKQKVFAGAASERVENLRYLKDLVESGQYRPLIDRSYPLDRIVDAHAYVEAGRKRGSVVVTMARA